MKVTYEGELFRSRAEAKWAAFFEAAGLHFERSAVNIDGDLWWPGFWLPEVKSWLVAAEEGLTRDELERSRRLAEATRRTVLLADGPPQPRDHILPVWRDSSLGLFGGETRDLTRATRCYFADDRRNEREFWLKSDTGGARSIGPVNGPDHQRDPGLYGAAAKAYDAARTVPLYDLDGKLLNAIISFKEFEKKNS